jgi:hypothetical protein
MSRTRLELWRRQWILTLLSVLVSIALFGAYEGLHGSAVPLRDASAPAVLAVDTAQEALGQAQNDAAAGPAASGDFRTHVGVANQSLAEAAADDVTGLSGQQTLQTVEGLITAYTGYVQLAQAEPEGSPLNRGYLHYADTVLQNRNSPESGILGRLAELQKDQKAEVGRQTAFSWPLWLGWVLVLLFSLALLGALLETQTYLRRKFKRRWSRPLIGAFALLAAGVAVLSCFTWWTKSGFGDSRAELMGSPQRAADIQEAGEKVSDYLGGTGFRAGLAGWILLAGVVLVALVIGALQYHIRDYRLRSSR